MANFIIKDFCADKLVKLKVDGFTILTGDSSSGKSSALKAIQAAATNRFGGSQVRFGCDKAVVQIQWEPKGEVISVARLATGGSPIVKFRGTTYSKLNRNVPSEIVDFHNLGVVQVGSELYNLNFSTQFQPPLLIKFSHKKVMEILSSSKSVEDFTRVTKKMADRRLLNRGEFNQVDNLLTSTKEKLSNLAQSYKRKKPLYDSVNELYKQYSQVDVLYNSLSKGVDSLNQNESSSIRISKITEELDLLSKIERLLEQKESLQTKKLELSKGIESIQVQEKSNSLLLKVESRLKMLDNIESKISLKEPLESLLPKVISILSSVESLSSKKNELVLISSKIENLNKIINLLEQKESLQNLKTKVVTASDKHFVNLSQSKKLLENLPMDLINEIEFLYRKKESLNSELTRVNRELLQWDSYSNSRSRYVDIENILTNNLCPVCGQKLSE